MRIGVAIFSYDGGLTFGVTGDYDEVPDIDVLSAGIEQSMRELVAAAEHDERTQASSPSAHNGGGRHAPSGRTRNGDL